MHLIPVADSSRQGLLWGREVSPSQSRSNSGTEAVRWKRWHHYHRGRSVLQYSDAPFCLKIVYGRVRSYTGCNDEVCRSQPQGGIRLQEGRFLSSTVLSSRQTSVYVYPQAGSATPDLSSSPSSSTSQAINLLYGTSIGKALLQVTCGPDPNAAYTSKDAQSWKAEVVFTNASYQAKKFVFLLFINRKPVSLF
jgi:hypothetical protein